MVNEIYIESRHIHFTLLL